MPPDPLLHNSLDDAIAAKKLLSESSDYLLPFPQLPSHLGGITDTHPEAKLGASPLRLVASASKRYWIQSLSPWKRAVPVF
ncbi:hypothetical protein D3C73_1450390 [compost metagenome]